MCRAFPLVLLFLPLFSNYAFSDGGYVWIESEKPSSFSGTEKLNSWAHEYFSGEWLHLSVDANKLDETIKGDAIVLRYDFESKAGSFELWNRIGFEYVRSPFEWRINESEWKTVSPDELTIDLMEVGFWCEIAWLKLGDVKLEKGKHTLEIRLSKRKNSEGKPERILYASDCICLHEGPFSPYSKYKPDQDHRTDKDKTASKLLFENDSKKIVLLMDVPRLKELGLNSDRVFSAFWEKEKAIGKNITPELVSEIIVLSPLEEPVKISEIATVSKSSRESVSKANKITLSGTWEICRDDELLPEPVVQPISRLPNTNRWSAITVPGDQNTLRPDMQFAHRIWYRTRFEIPQEIENPSAYIEFPQNNLNTTVYLNGELCGFDKNPFAKVQIDISKPLKPGVNELYVGIRDAWYGFTEKPDDPMKLRKKFNLPKKYFNDGFQDLVYPIWNHPQSGILHAPSIHFFEGPVYISDVFVKPSVAKKELAFDIMLKNVSETDQTIELENYCRYRQAYWNQQGEEEGAFGTWYTSRIRDENFTGYQYLGDDDINEDISSSPSSDVAKKFETKTVTVKANSETVVHLSEKWDEPKLWTPQKPFLYHLYSNVLGKDFRSVKTTEFGFREWSTDGKNFLLNGKPFHGWADTFDKPGKIDWLKFYRESNQSMMRFWATSWKGMAPSEALKFFDENGVVVRRSGIFDGEAIGYNVIENDPELRAKNKAEDPDKEQIKMDLFQNWRDQMVAQVKGERNHPSIMLWSIENEILYINCVNLYGGLMDRFEDEIIKTAQAVKEVDPTRTSMVDGGGATKRGNPGSEPGEGLEVHGDHYVFKDFTKYPDRAYETNPAGGGHGNRWFWDEKRPRFIGEDFYVNGIHPSEFAVIGGEEAFSGRTGAKRAVGILYKMLTEGYRWSEYGAWHFWVGQDRASDQYTSNAPIAVFCREYDWTFEAGKEIKRTMRIFNDTQEDMKIRFVSDWESPSLDIIFPGTRVIIKDFSIPAGKSETFTLSLQLPRLLHQAESPGKRLADRIEADWNLTLSVPERNEENWATVFEDRKRVSLLANNPKLHRAGTSSVSTETGKDTDSDSARFSLLLYDPNESVSAHLNKAEIRHKTINSLDDIPKSENGNSILILGKDSLTATDCDSPVLQAFAAQGGRVIVLEQQFPLRYGGLPCEMELAQNEGRTAFIENESHPIFKRLKNKDFFTWADGHIVYRNAYKKPVRGARSLLQCDQRLENSAVIEIPVGEGVMILSQLLIGEKLDKSVVARLILGNMIQYAYEYSRPDVTLVECTSDFSNDFFTEKLENGDYSVDAFSETASTPMEAVRARYWHVAGSEKRFPAEAVVMIGASENNLRELLDNKDELQEFYNVGGVIILCGLTPEGLETFNKLVGFEHQIRPFVREKVVFSYPRHPLSQGLTLSDISLSSGVRMFDWANDEYVASDTFSYVIDTYDIAPFGKYRNDFEKMMSNGMLSADGWPYIVNLPAPENPPLDFPILFPKEQTIEELIWTGNTFYSPVTEISLFFDGLPEDRVTFNVEPNTEPQVLSFDPPIKGKNLTLRLEAWTPVPGKEKTTGLDNIVLKPLRSDEFKKRVKPFFNVGGLVQYDLSEPQNGGGIILCNLKLNENEAVAINGVKKRKIFTELLRNLGVKIPEPKSIIPGTPLVYENIDISKHCNEFRDEKGWFGDKNFSFASFPRGKQKFAGVPFDVHDFPTSPVPDCIVLKNEDVTGIKIGKKADAVFFLQTAKLDRRRNRDELRDGKAFELFKYVIRYADGQTLEVPIYSEIDIDDYKRKPPVPIPGAMLAWTRKYDNSEDSAVAYIKQWTNPRSDIEIESIDIVRGKDDIGRPAILAITTALEFE